MDVMVMQVGEHEAVVLEKAEPVLA